MVKNALILHGTDADHTHNWFPWLQKELETLGYELWVPNLPSADHPNIKRYNQFLLNYRGPSGTSPINWKFDEESIIIGHSSGAVEILGLLNDPEFHKDLKLILFFSRCI